MTNSNTNKGARLGLVGVIRHDDIPMAEAGNRFDFPLKVGKDSQDHKLRARAIRTRKESAHHRSWEQDSGIAIPCESNLPVIGKQIPV